MDNRKDLMDQIITEDLLEEAQSIDKEIADADMEEMPEGVEEAIKKRLHAQIDEYEKERVYARLSEEDRKALELGKEMLRDKSKDNSDEKRVYRKRSRKVYVAVAAVAVLVLAMGVTSMGGAERIAEMIGIKVGTREVVQINTDEDNYIVTSDEEEEAYQELRNVFGVDPVKIVHWPGEVKFLAAEIDKDLQTATLTYEYGEEIINYFISSQFMKGSWGVDVEDSVIKYDYIQNESVDIEVKVYETPETNIERYSACYTYNNLDYFLIGTMEEQEFEFLIKNLKFF